MPVAVKFLCGFVFLLSLSLLEFSTVNRPSTHTPYQAPLANALCERIATQRHFSVGSVRREGLDHGLVRGVRQLVRILTDYIRDFNPARPHQGIEQRIPEATQSPPGEPKTGTVIAFPVLNGLHHDYPVLRVARRAKVPLAGTQDYRWAA